MSPRFPSPNTFLAAKGFSLVEVALTIGLVALTFTTLVTLLPLACQQLKTAMDTTTAAQIARTVVSDFEAAGLKEVLDHDTEAQRLWRTFPGRYFTSAGREVAKDHSDRVYQVNMRVLRDEQVPGAGSQEGVRGCVVLTIEVVAIPAGARATIGQNGLVDREHTPHAVSTFPYVIGGHSAR